MEFISLLTELIIFLVKSFSRHLPHLIDQAFYGIQWITIAYILFLLAYNLARAIWKRILKSQPRQWPRWLWRVLGLGSRYASFFLRSRLPRLLLALARSLAYELQFYGEFSWHWCCESWGAWVAYRRAAAGALRALQGHFDVSACLSTFRLGFLVRLLGHSLLAFFRTYRQALRDHHRFISTSAVNFLERPFTQEWTVFRFFKHLLGITFGITFFFYLFLWSAYVLYFFFDCLFLFIEVVCFHFLQPLFFPSGALAFSKAYAIVVAGPRDFIMIGLFETLPTRVKAFKDRIFPRAWFRRRVARPLLKHLEILFWRGVRGLFRFVTITAYYQTRYFLRLFWKLVLYVWYRRYRYRRLLLKLKPGALYKGSKRLLGPLFRKTWWRYIFFLMRDRWRWFSFVCRRYLFLPPWRRWQYRYRKGLWRFSFRLRHWAAYGKLLGSLLLWLALLAAALVFLLA